MEAPRIELGKYIVADPAVCHGKPTFTGTRIMVANVLEQLSDGLSLDEVVTLWNGRISKAAVLETLSIASQMMALDQYALAQKLAHATAG